MTDRLDAAMSEVSRLSGVLHSFERHPDYEYATTSGPRKGWEPSPPSGDGWTVNRYRGREGWERFEYHEEAYWMRPLPPVSALLERLVGGKR